jgi:hypothetical protein
VFEVFKLAASAFLGMMAAFAVQWIKTGRDEHRALCDELCKVMGDAADHASAYWLTAADGAEIELKEARLMGYQSRLAGLKVLVEKQFSQEDAEQVADALSDLFDALTGGDFQVSGRNVDAQRCHQAQVMASVAMVSVRNAYRNSVAFPTMSRRLSAKASSGVRSVPVHYRTISDLARQLRDRWWPR